MSTVAHTPAVELAAIHDARPRRRKLPRGPQRWAAIIALTLFGISAIAPMIFMLVTAFRTQNQWVHAKLGLPTTLSFRAFEAAWTEAHIGTYFRNSMIVTVGTLALTIVSATLAGYSTSKMRWPGRGIVYFSLIAFIAIPPLLLMVPVYVELVKLGLFNTYWSVIFIYTAFNLPFNVYLMRNFFGALPDELIEAARLDGANVHRVFFRVMLPLARPAIATLAIFNFLWVWNEFLYALLLLQTDSVKTLTVGVLSLQGRFNADYPTLMAGLFLATAPVVGVYLFFQRHLVRAIVAGAVK
jgi:ABC-type glycerol-3-phosphate transport system permease component